MSIVRTYHDKSNPYVMVNRAAIDDPKLSWAAKGLWIYLMGRPDTWKVSVSHLASLYEGRGGGRDAIYAYLSELIDAGYCMRIPIREKGKFKEFEYAVYEHPNLIMPYPYTTESFTPNLPPLTGKPEVVEPDTANPTLAMTDVLASNDINKGNVNGTGQGSEKGLPQSSKRSKRLYPLKSNQRPLLHWLLSQNIDSDDDTLIYYIRTYSEEKIREAIRFIDRETEKGCHIKSRGAVLRSILEGRIIIQTVVSERNKQMANDFVRLNEWRSAVITEKYLRDEVTGDDIYFHLDAKTFDNQLNKLHEKSLMYQ